MYFECLILKVVGVLIFYFLFLKKIKIYDIYIVKLLNIGLDVLFFFGGKIFGFEYN